MVLALYTPIDLPDMVVDRQEFIEWHEANRKRNANDNCRNI